MIKQTYKKTKKKNVKKIIRFLGLGISISALLLGFYVFFPLLSWELYLQPVFASNSFASPIPKNTILTKNFIKSLVSNTTNALSGVDYNDASNWLPPSYKHVATAQQIPSYFLSIPKLDIENATVSTIDTDLSKHLVQYPGTAIPSNRGTAAIFGHSTLPQLFDKKDYKTIFANIHKLEIGDNIIVTSNNTVYVYKIFDLIITGPEDTSYLVQNYDASYLNIITCTPPGTTWKRLIVKSRLDKS